MAKTEKHRMYKLYMVIDVINAFGLIPPFICLCVVVYKLVQALSWGYLDVEDGKLIFGMAVAIVFFCIYFIPRLGNHYSRIDKVRKVDPGLVRQYEDEFILAEDLGNEIWLSQNFLFISGAKKFVVATPDEIKSIRVYIRYTKHGSWIKYELKGKDFNETVQIGNLREDGVKEYANISIDKLAAWTSATIMYDKDVKKRLER